MRDEGVELLIPETYGAETVRRKTKDRHRWDREQVFASIAENFSSEAASQLRDFATWSEDRGAELITGVGKNPTLNAWFPVGEGRPRVWYLGSNDALSIIWDSIRKGAGNGAALRLLATLRTQAALATRLVDAESKSDSSFPITLLASDPEAFDVLKSGIEQLVTPF